MLGRLLAERREIEDRKFATAYRQREQLDALQSLMSGPRVGRDTSEEEGLGCEGGDIEGGVAAHGDEAEEAAEREREEKMKYGSFAKVTEVGVCSRRTTTALFYLYS